MSHALLLRCHISHPYPDYHRLPVLVTGTKDSLPVLSLVFPYFLTIINPLEKTTRLWDSLPPYQALPHLTLPLFLVGRLHIWASASRLIPSAFRCPAAQSGRYRSIPVLDWAPIFRYRIGFGIGSNFLSVSGLTGGRTVCQYSYKKTVRLHCSRWRGYTLHVFAASDREGYTLYSTLKAMERVTPCIPNCR